jgi:hypothetical protein
MASEKDFCFQAWFTNYGGIEPGGNNSITAGVYSGTTQVIADVTVGTASATICFSGLNALDPGTYSVKVHFQHTPSDNGQPVNGTYSFPLTISPADLCGGGGNPGGECYNGALVKRFAVVPTSQSFEPISVAFDMVVSNCGTDPLTNVKLQGGLVNKASSPSGSYSGDAYPVKDNSKWNSGGANFVYSWTFTLPAGGVETFSVSYTVWPTACGNPLTGPWSLKKPDGTVIGVAPADQYNSTGYYDRLYYECN